MNHQGCCLDCFLGISGRFRYYFVLSLFDQREYWVYYFENSSPGFVRPYLLLWLGDFGNRKVAYLPVRMRMDPNVGISDSFARDCNFLQFGLKVVLRFLQFDFLQSVSYFLEFVYDFLKSDHFRYYFVSSLLGH